MDIWKHHWPSHPDTLLQLRLGSRRFYHSKRWKIDNFSFLCCLFLTVFLFDVFKKIWYKFVSCQEHFRNNRGDCGSLSALDVCGYLSFQRNIMVAKYWKPFILYFVCLYYFSHPPRMKIYSYLPFKRRAVVSRYPHTRFSRKIKTSHIILSEIFAWWKINWIRIFLFHTIFAAHCSERVFWDVSLLGGFKRDPHETVAEK